MRACVCVCMPHQTGSSPCQYGYIYSCVKEKFCVNVVFACGVRVIEKFQSAIQNKF